MKKLAIIPLVALLCLLGGCTLQNVSHFFAQAEDFVRGEPKVSTTTGGGSEQGGGGGTSGQRTITIVSQGDALSGIKVTSDQVDSSQQPIFTGTPSDISPADGITFAAIQGAPAGSYTMTFGVVDPNDGSTTFNFSLKFSIDLTDSDITLLVLDNNNGTNPPEVRVVKVPGAMVADPVTS